MSFAIPDLRFEQTFYRQLDGYAKKSKGAKASSEKPQVSAAIVAYAIMKDQVVMAFLQGFLWAGILLLLGPMRRFLILQGQAAGQALYQLIGLGRMGGRMA